MDPNETLRRLRELAWDWRANAPDDAPNVAEKMAEHVESLDNWLTNGGFLPDDWQRK